jgi:hypothetical protein
MTLRVVKVQHVVVSEIQGKRTRTLEGVHEASVESSGKFFLDVGRILNKPCLQGLIYPGKYSVCIGMILTYLRPI